MTQATRSALMSVDTTLAASIDATQDYIPVASTTNFSTSVVAEIETTNEVVSFDSITTNLATYSQEFELEYGKSTIEIHKDSIEKNEKVIIVDDLIATGGTAKAAAKLVEKSGGKIESFVFIINLFDLGGKNLLEKESYKTLSLIDFPGH